MNADTVEVCRKCKGTGVRRGETCAACAGQKRVLVITLDDGGKVVKPAGASYQIALPSRKE